MFLIVGGSASHLQQPTLPSALPTPQRCERSPAKPHVLQYLDDPAGSRDLTRIQVELLMNLTMPRGRRPHLFAGLVSTHAYLPSHQILPFKMDTTNLYDADIVC